MSEQFMWSEANDPTDWSPVHDFSKPIATLPGLVLALQPSQLADQLWALCRVERRWWEFWQPKTREKWIHVTIDSPSNEA